MKVLAIDQATGVVGFSVLKGVKEEDLIYYKEFTLNKRDDILTRIDCVLKEIANQIKEHKPDVVVIEDIQFQNNAQTFKKLAWLQGIIIYYLKRKNIEYDIIAPSVWRKKNQIRGRLRKEQKANAIIFVQNHYGIKLTDDVAEAILLGRAYYFIKGDIK